MQGAERGSRGSNCGEEKGQLSFYTLEKRVETSEQKLPRDYVEAC